MPDRRTVFFDVDDTLICWCPPNTEAEFIDMSGVPGHDADCYSRLRRNEKHIDALKEHHKQGDIVVVWSAGGSDWVEIIVRVLKLESYVSLIINKPFRSYDDLDPSYWANRVYIDD